MKILLIEDERQIANSIKEMLKVYYAIDIAYTGQKGEELIYDNDYDAVILDIVLPDIGGFQICKSIRENEIKTPIIMLTGKAETKDKINALNLGADDYLTKPFSFEELHARLQALIRRSPNGFSSDKLAIDGLVLDAVSNTVEYKGNKIELRLKEFRLLEYLMRNAGKVLTRSMILEHVWESATNYSEQILNELMWRKNNLATFDLSEILTDRLVAEMEIITPRVLTDKVETKNLCVGDGNGQTCITKSQLDQILSKFDIGVTEVMVPTPTGVGITLDTSLLTR